MQSLRHVTPVPNAFIDKILRDLGYAEVKILLVIMRQTFGWHDARTGKRRERDWISQRYFAQKSGLSARAVSTAIANLSDKGMITVSNAQGEPLRDIRQRRHASKLYFETKLIPSRTKSCEVDDTKPVKQLHTTKESFYKVLYSERTSLVKKLTYTQRKEKED